MASRSTTSTTTAAATLRWGTNLSIYVFLNAGGRSFLPRQEYRDRPSASVSVGDLNGDGNPDLVTANPIGDGDEDDETDRTQTVTVRLGTGTGVLGPPRRYQVGRGPEHVAVGNLNGDRRQDLLVSNNDFHGAEEYDPYNPFQPLVDPDYVSILYGRGDGTLEPQVKVPTGDGPIASVIADFDRDGRSDFAVALAGEDAVQVFITGDDDTDGGSRSGDGDGQQPEGGVDAGFGGGGGDEVLYGNAGADRFFAEAGRDILRLVDWVAGNDFAAGG